jgi:hypothetical protein
MRNTSKFWLENLKGRDHLEDLHVDGRKIFKSDLRETGWEDVDLIYLAQDRDQWQMLVNTVMNLGVPQKSGNFLSE